MFAVGRGVERGCIYGEDAIKVIKLVREVACIGLKEAKDLAESAPRIIKKDLSREEADLLAV